MAFEEVCEMERVQGDPSYTAWLAAGKPVLDAADTPKMLEGVSKQAR